MAEEGIKRWVILFRGYTQREGSFTGLERLYYKVKRVVGNGGNETILRAWTADVEEIADRIFHNSDSSPTVIVIGYSWGGQTAVNLCKSLRKRGLSVNWLFLCDAVYRARHWWQYPRSLLSWFSIRVPGNVARLWYCYQRENKPMGHTIHTEDGTVVYGRKPFVGVTHAHMDDQNSFHDAVLERIAA